MLNLTDRVPPGSVYGSEDPKLAAGRVLESVAVHLTVVNPTQVMEGYTLPVCVGAEAFRLAERPSFPDATEAAKAAMEMAPVVRDGITRGEYALLLRKVVRAAGGAR